MPGPTCKYMIHDRDCPCHDEADVPDLMTALAGSLKSSCADVRLRATNTVLRHTQPDAVQLKLSELQSDYDHAWQDRQSAQERMDAAQEQAQALGVDLA